MCSNKSDGKTQSVVRHLNDSSCFRDIFSHRELIQLHFKTDIVLQNNLILRLKTWIQSLLKIFPRTILCILCLSFAFYFNFIEMYNIQKANLYYVTVVNCCNDNAIVRYIWRKVKVWWGLDAIWLQILLHTKVAFACARLAELVLRLGPWLGLLVAERYSYAMIEGSCWIRVTHGKKNYDLVETC